MRLGDDELENQLRDRIHNFWLGSITDHIRILITCLFLATLSSFIFTSFSDTLLLQSQNEIYYISVSSLLLGMSYAFIRYAKTTMYFCLESLDYERKKYVNRHLREEGVKISEEKRYEEERSIEELDDFENILRDLEQILQEE